MNAEDRQSGAPTGSGLAQAFPQFHDFALIALTGLSSVYSVRDRRGGPRLALKLSPVVREDDLPVRKFEEEVRLLTKQHSEHLVTITAYGRVEVRLANGAVGTYAWYAMHLCMGGSVLSKLAMLSLQQRTAIVEQMLSGLGYLHAVHIAHRDIKPHNLLLDSLDPLVVKIGDFGIAKDRAPLGDELGNSRLVGGTSPYLAPERVSPGYLEQAAPDWRPSDQYAAAVTLYQILAVTSMPLDVAGEAWGQMNWAQVHEAHHKRPLRPLQIPERPGWAFKGLDRVIARMMAVNPMERFPRIQDCWLNLRAALLADGVL